MMKFFKYLLKTLTLLISIEVSAKPSSAQIEEIFQEIAKDMRPYLKTLSRDIFVYHWHNSKIAKSARLKALRSKFFKHQSKGSDVVGKGFYAAQEPHVTKYFGKKLIVLGVPRGSVIYDIRHKKMLPSRIPVSEKTIQLIRRANIAGVFGVEEFQTIRTNYTINKRMLVKKYSNEFKKLFQELGIQLWSYKYVKSKVNICDNFSGGMKVLPAAFVVTGKDVKIVESYKEGKEYSTSISAAVSHLYKSRDSRYQIKDFIKVDQHLIRESGQGLDYKIKRKTFGCLQGFQEDQAPKF